MRMELRPGLSVSEAIVHAVAAEIGCDPMEMRPLGEVIDTDALEALFNESAPDSPETLTLEYQDCRVSVNPDAIAVEESLEA